MKRTNISKGLLLIFLFGMSLFFSSTIFAETQVRSSAGNTYTIDKDWAKLPAGQEWGGATSWVAVDGRGQVLVLVRTAPYFRLFNRDGEFLSAWGNEEGSFQNAHSVTFDVRGNVWATDAAKHVVYQYNTEGELLATLGKAGEAGDNASKELFNQANHVGMAANGDLYISDGYQNSRIAHYTAAGDFVRMLAGIKGEMMGMLDVPHGVVEDSQGRIIVNDSGNQRVSVFGPEGGFIESWPYPSRGGIAIAPDDTVYISDVNAGEINLVKDGLLVDSIVVDIRPHSLALDTDGAIYVSDARGQVVMKITRQN